MTLTLPYGFGCCGRRQRPSGRVKTRVEIRKSSLRAFLFRSGLVKPPATEVGIDVPVMETYYVPITLALGPPHRKGGSPSALICEGRGLCPVGGGEEYHVTYVVEPNPLSKTNNTGEVSLSHFRRGQYQHTVYIQDCRSVALRRVCTWDTVKTSTTNAGHATSYGGMCRSAAQFLNRRRFAKDPLCNRASSPNSGSLSAPQDRGHDARAAASVHHCDNPQRFLIRRIGNKVIAYAMESKRP
jgi:hypothetical protein